MRTDRHDDAAPIMNTTSPDTYETPTKVARTVEKHCEKHTQKLTSSTRIVIRDVSNDCALAQYQGARPVTVTLSVQLVADATSTPIVVEATSWHTPNEVKEGIASHINVEPELLKLSSSLNGAKPKFNSPLEMSQWQHGPTIICHKLETPTSFDRVAVCDQCGDWRHVFYGYAKRDPLADPEPVIELCADWNVAARL